jgi:hypothetical protein
MDRIPSSLIRLHGAVHVGRTHRIDKAAAAGGLPPEREALPRPLAARFDLRGRPTLAPVDADIDPGDAGRRPGPTPDFDRRFLCRNVATVPPDRCRSTRHCRSGASAGQAAGGHRRIDGGFRPAARGAAANLRNSVLPAAPRGPRCRAAIAQDRCAVARDDRGIRPEHRRSSNLQLERGTPDDLRPFAAAGRRLTRTPDRGHDGARLQREDADFALMTRHIGSRSAISC